MLLASTIAGVFSERFRREATSEVGAALAALATVVIAISRVGIHPPSAEPLP